MSDEAKVVHEWGTGEGLYMHTIYRNPGAQSLIAITVVQPGGPSMSPTGGLLLDELARLVARVKELERIGGAALERAGLAERERDALALEAELCSPPKARAALEKP